MKKILVGLAVILAISSCTIKEKMVIGEDGSGTFSYGFDLSGMFKLGMKSKDSTKVKKVIDTTFTFKALFDKAKDSITALTELDQAKLKVLEDFKISMKIDEDKKQFEYSMSFEFESLDSLQNMVAPAEAFETLALADKERLGAMATAPKKQHNNTATFSYDGQFFSKNIVAVKGGGKANSKVKKKKATAKSDDPLSVKMEEMLKECKYVVEYHFPKRIKTVSLKNVIIAADRKSFVSDVLLEDLPDKNAELGFKVLFEN